MVDKMRPLADKVLVKRLEKEEKTAGGIIIPDSAQEKAQQGRVVSAGPGKTLNDGRVVPLAVKAGDMIFFGKYSGTEAGNDFLIIREDEILGIVE